YIIVGEEKIFADKYIICTGGKSYPGTGSTGDGFKWATKLGHSVTELFPSLVPVKISDEWVKELQGLSLKNVELNIYHNNKKQYSIFGEMLFTHFGISGPIVLTASKMIGQLLKKGEVKVSIDLKPALDLTKLDKRILRDFREYQNKLFKNSLKDLLPQKLIPVIIRLSGIDPDKQVNSITKKERYKIISILKNLEMNVSGLLGFDYSLVTSGGINIKEIDPKTMKSKLIKNLYFAGEIIDIDGPTGGYNLQMCWTTGYIAGQNAAIKEN
ncbi:MAG: NAD(P)/FAD-dependent oxidoreductase, partial [bacterium]